MAKGRRISLVDLRGLAMLRAIEKAGGVGKSAGLNSTVLTDNESLFAGTEEKSRSPSLTMARKSLEDKGFLQKLMNESWRLTDAGKSRLQQIRQNPKSYGDNVLAIVGPPPPDVAPPLRPKPEAAPPVSIPVTMAIAPGGPGAEGLEVTLRRLESALKEVVAVGARAELQDELRAMLRLDLGVSTANAPARNCIFSGPPGTGKTLLAKVVAEALTNEKPSPQGAVRVAQFHPSYGYEDFVWGIRPLLRDQKFKASAEGPAQLGFEEQPGPFMAICGAARENPTRIFVLIIDEINRGDPARIFGELLYALEYRGQEVLLANGKALVVPPNLVVIGTMNSVDRSVALVDYALRRRFSFIRVDPAPELIERKHRTAAGAAAARALRFVNEHITREIAAPDSQLGHSYFLSPGRTLETRADVDRIWKMDLAPQLAELFHGQIDRLKELKQIWDEQLRQAFAVEQRTEK